MKVLRGFVYVRASAKLTSGCRHRWTSCRASAWLRKCSIPRAPRCLTDEPTDDRWPPVDGSRLLCTQCDRSNGSPEDMEQSCVNKIIIERIFFANLVCGALDVHESAALCQRALQSQHHVAGQQWFEVSRLQSTQQFRRWSFPAIQRLAKLFVIASVRVVPDGLTHHINLKQHRQFVRVTFGIVDGVWVAPLTVPRCRQYSPTRTLCRRRH